MKNKNYDLTFGILYRTQVVSGTAFSSNKKYSLYLHFLI